MSKKQEILNVAEARVRTGGYNSFSFRDLAEAVGVKSSSVHYHFKTKEELGAELARQYTDSFLSSLGEPEALQESGKHPISTYIEHFKNALIKDNKMCLCGLLGAESDGLPEAIQTEVQQFFSRNITWLTKAYELVNASSIEEAKQKAIQTISLLEGAMLISITMKDSNIFEQAIL